LVPVWPATISAREAGRGANLESEIPSKLYRDIAQAGDPDGCLRVAGGCAPKRAIRPGERSIAAFAPTRCAAGHALHGRGWRRTAGDCGAAAIEQSSAGSRGSTLCVTWRETAADGRVTDAKGGPDGDLKESGFNNANDAGRPQPARSFQGFAMETPLEGPISPPLPSNVATDLHPAPTASAVNNLLLDARKMLPGEQFAINNNKVGAPEIRL